MTQATNAFPEDLIVRARIVELLDDFFGRVDRGEPVEELLEPQSTFKTHIRHAEGSKAISEMLVSLAGSRKEKGRTARHFGGSVNIENLGSGRYRVRSLVIVLSLDSQPAAAGVLNMGDHDDIVVFGADGKCRFELRSMSPVMQLGLTA